MLIRRLAALGLAVALIVSVSTTFVSLSGCTKAQPAALAGVANVQSVYVVGTLCSGGFECQWAPQATALDVARHTLLVLADKAAISKDAAQEVQARLNDAHTYLQDSKDACAFDNAGNCTKDAAKAAEALQAATVALAAARKALESVAIAAPTDPSVILTGASHS